MINNLTKYHSPLDLSLIARNVVLIEGIWFSKTESFISYPDEGNENCYQVEENSFWFKHRNSMIVSTIKKFPPEGCMFDIGGGNGFVSKSIFENGFDIFLIEPGLSGIHNAKKRGITNLLCATMADAQFEKESIDAMGMFDVVEHIENDLEFLKDAFQYLKPGGLLYLTVPSYQFLWSHYDKRAGHYRRYTLRKLSRLIKSSGLKIRYKSYFFILLPIPIFIFRTIPNLIAQIITINKKSKISGSHVSPKGFIGFILDSVFKYEMTQLKRSKKIFFGGSCILVAQKDLKIDDPL